MGLTKWVGWSGGMRPSPPMGDPPRKILLIQLKRAGDVVLTTPVAEALKRTFPQTTVEFLVDADFASLLDHNPSVDQVKVYDRARPLRTLLDIRRARYDWVFDFQSSPRSAPVAIASGARLTAGFGVPFWGAFYKFTVPRPGAQTGVVRGKLSLIEPWAGAIREAPERRVCVTEQERDWARRTLPESGRAGWIGLIPPHRHESRRWPGSHFAGLAALLQQAGYDVALFGGPGEEACILEVHAAAPQARTVNVASFRQWAALLERCRLVVSNDNGPMHIAVAVGSPTVTLYGPTEAACLKPERSCHRGLQAADVTCLGCNMNQCPFAHECMTHILPERVFESCQELLQEANRL